MAGYDNNLVVTNLGTLFFVLVGHLSFFMIHIILFVLSKCSKTVDKARQRLSSYLYFSGSIRLVMEGLLDLVLFSLINLKDADWSGDFLMVTVNNWCAISILVIGISFPIAMIIVLVFNTKRWDEE